MYRVELDKNNYLIGFYQDDEGKYDFDPSKMNLDYKTCYKLVDGEFVFDEEKKQAIDEEVEKAYEISGLKEYLISTSDVANDFVEQLFSLTNPLTFVSDLISLMSTYKNTYKTILAERKKARDRLKELEG